MIRPALLWLRRLLLPGVTAIALILMGLYGLLRFWILPELPRYRPQLESSLGILLGERLRIGTLTAELQGLDPALLARDVCVLDPASSPLLCLARIEVHLNTWASLLTLQPAIHRLVITGTELTVVRNRSGHLQLSGLNATGETPAWLLATRHITLIDARLHWQDQNRGDTIHYLGTVTLGLTLRDGQHHLTLNARLADELGQRISGQVYWASDTGTAGGQLELDQVRLDAIEPLWPALPVHLSEGVLSGSLDGEWRGPDRQTVQGDLRLSETRLTRYGGDDRTLRLALPRARFTLTHAAQDWQVLLSRLQPRIGTLWPESSASASLRLDMDGLPTRFDLSADYVELGDMATVIRVLAPADSTAMTLVSALNPQGTLHRVRLQHTPGANPGQRWEGQAEAKNLALQAWQNIPGLHGGNLTLAGNDLNGTLALNLSPGQLDLPRLGLRSGLAFDRLNATAKWLKSDEAWAITLESLRFAAGAFQGEVNMHLTLPTLSEQSPLIDLKGQFQGIDAARALALMPRAVIPHTANWFDRALRRGLIRQCELVLKGPLQHFPFRQNEGLFEAVLDVDAVDLQFHPEWLPLTDTAARVRFHGPGLDVESKRGRIGQAQLVDVTAHVDDLLNQPWLKLAGIATASVGEAFELLSHSPIRRIPEQLNRLLSVSGNTRVSLQLEVPLDHRLGETAVQGTARFSEAGLRFRDLGLEVDRIEGPLDFTREKLSARGITGRFLSHPIGVKLDQDDKNIYIDVDSTADTPALSQLFTRLGGAEGSLFPAAFWQRVKGVMDYQVHLALPESLGARNEDFKLKVQSTLQGLALDLPAPLGKTGQELTPLTVDLTLRQGNDAPLRLSLGQTLQALLRFSEPGKGFLWKGGEIAVGRTLSENRTTNGLGLQARLDDMDITAWLPLWRLLKKPDAEAVETTLIKARPVQARTAVGLDRLDLEVARLSWQRQSLGDLQVSLKQDNALYTGTVKGDRIQGHFSAGPEQVKLKLDRLRWPRWQADGPVASSLPDDPVPPPAGETCLPKATACIEPDTWPPLHLQIDQLVWHEVELGQLQLETQKTPGHYKLSRLRWLAPGRELTLTGEWNHRWGHRQTQIRGDLRLDGLEQTLSLLGWPGKVRDTPARFDFDLAWPGGPQQFATEHLGGQVAVDLGKGGLPAIDPGLGRVLGLLNLDTLWRRLNFDFSDLFGKGLAYDSVKGRLRLDQGQILTEGLLIDAVPARILISGRAGLVEHDLDQTVTVIPHTSASLPIAGVLAGGPAVGAAVLVAQQLIGDKVDTMAASHYSVKGPWQSPRIEKMAQGPSMEWLNKAWSGIKTFSGLSPTPTGTPAEQE